MAYNFPSATSHKSLLFLPAVLCKSLANDTLEMRQRSSRHAELEVAQLAATFSLEPKQRPNVRCRYVFTRCPILFREQCFFRLLISCPLIRASSTERSRILRGKKSGRQSTVWINRRAAQRRECDENEAAKR